jgi:hypothetical protein
MKNLRSTFLYFLLSVTSLMPSAALGQDSSATQSKNYENCLYGRFGCDPTRLTADEKEAVAKSAHVRNYQNCLYGRFGCNSAQLTAEEKEAVAKSAHDRNYQNCFYGLHGCDSTQLTAEEKEVIAQAGQKQSSAQTPTPRSGLSNDNYYTNSDGNRVHSPANSNTVPSGATAQCRDGSYSFSQHRQGTCSHHGVIFARFNVCSIVSQHPEIVKAIQKLLRQDDLGSQITDAFLQILSFSSAFSA